MQTTKSSKTLAALALILSLQPASQAAQTPNPSMGELAQMSNDLLSKKFSKKEIAQLRLQLIQYMALVLKVNPLQVAQTKQLSPMDIQDLSQLETTPQETRSLEILAQMIDQKTLKPNINKLIEEIKKQPGSIGQQVQALTPQQQEYAINALNASVEAITKMRGMTKDSSGISYKEWSELSKEMLKEVKQYRDSDIAEIADSKWVRTEAAEILVDGPASFAKRDQQIREATQSINILTWSIYDDVTGTELVDMLLQKKQTNPGIQIRVMVDGQVAMTSGHKIQVDRLESAGIPVIRWFNPKVTYVGQHRKMMIVDNQHMISGGLNFGDVYSHKSKDPAVKKWRDTDVYVKGAGAAEGNRLFAKLWNEQLEMQPKLVDEKNYAEMDVEKFRGQESSSDVEVSIINHNPRKAKDGSTIMLALLKAIREAKTKVDIENAYVILFPALKQEISAAVARGVKVRIFTNSSESVDEPVVSIPILRSVVEFSKMGAQVFIKKGATLHSKFAVIDSNLSIVTSYNLHPRSERVEGEMAVMIRDQAFAQNLHQVFERDIAPENATEIKSPSDIQFPSSPAAVPTLRIFFDML